ncbi:MAG: CBS domain-containing protein [Burkholderiaceae bacterium]|nr:CBS domain-containing protein [Burkholderiaceae bacterium]
MLVRDWMQADPITIASDTLVSQAKRLLADHNLHALPVVDDGRLRGLVTRANLLRMGAFVLRTQDPDEFNYFVTRLRVRDVMVRRPATIQAGDTMQQCLRRGRELGVAQFPVLDGERVVGVISANEIFQIAAHCLGAWERRNGLTIGPVRLEPGVIGRVAEVAERAGAVLQALFPVLGRRDAPCSDGSSPCRLIVCFDAGDVGAVAAALAADGFPVIESIAPVPPVAAARIPHPA